MALIGLKCPNCNGEIQMDDTKENGFCMYCGSNFQVKDEVQRIQIEHSGSVSINRDQELENLIIRTEQKIKEYMVTYVLEAEIFNVGNKLSENYIDKILDIQPNHLKAIELKQMLARAELAKYKNAQKTKIIAFFVVIGVILLAGAAISSCFR